MKYKSVELKKKNRDLLDAAITIYLESNSIEQFENNLNKTLPEAKSLIILFKLYYFSATFKLLWVLMHIGLLAVFIAIGAMFSVDASMIGILIYLILEIFYQYKIGDIFRCIKWNEDGRPRDY